MKKSFIALLLMVLAASSISAQQGRRSLFMAMQETNRMMEIYDRFQAGSVEFHCFTDLEFKPYEIDRILSDKYLANYLSREKDSIAVFAAIELFQERIADNLREVVSHPDFLRRMNKRQTLSELKNIDVAVSDDSRLFCFAYDGKSGYAHPTQVCVMHYNRPTPPRATQSWSKSANVQNEKISPAAYRTFSNNGYTEIHMLSREPAQYLLIGQSKKGGGNYECYADLMTFKNGAFVKSFEHQARTAKPEGCIIFDKKSGMLTVQGDTFLFSGTTFVKK